jgi:outer membrane protein, heavy metal efflux system
MLGTNIGRTALWLMLFAATATAQPSPDKSATAVPQSEHDSEHVDTLDIDPQLSFAQLLDLTMDKYPDRLISEAMQQRADAWQTRGESWTAGSDALSLDYSDDRIAQNTGQRDIRAQLEFTVWFWGQRAAALDIAEQAKRAADKHSQALRLEVASLLRDALWTMDATKVAAQQAELNQKLAEQWFNKVKTRVEAGDLAHSDLLLAESDYLQSRSQFLQAQAEMMHARKNYSNLTQMQRMPLQYKETQSEINEIQAQHPYLEAVNALIASKQANIEWAKTTDTINQPKVHIFGIDTRNNVYSGDYQSAGVGVVIPFGHASYDAPEIANAHLELNQALAQREHLLRLLEKNLHEAEHVLSVTRAELSLAKQRRELAEKQLKMTEISFNAGEISLLDVLKIKALSLESIAYANQQEVKLQRDIAFYNQAAGVLP